ncbi:MAG TPA: CDP-alcohol phosphatidyltransferase family protein [Chitinivibrionales bacterium]|nr:CDP-alcohol phosphatidyltransferase family protein [Chitinivibrionales bacterium]
MRIKIHPNLITAFGVLLSLIAGYFCATGKWYLAALIVFVGSCMDGLDGLVARQAGKTTAFGAVFDSACDRITETAWFFGILYFYLQRPVFGREGVWLSFLAMAGSLMVSYVRARCEAAAIACKQGLLQRPERIIVLIACLLAGPRIMAWGLGLLALLSYATVVQRLVIARRADKNAD